ncbi:UrcA family protein [Sphingopyxis kveilinensis]|uniref:UrcA family protein n=1 Tax=Sphingopyxis kveilinensis TaxID=3114367 RepID=UPI0030D596F8
MQKLMILAATAAALVVQPVSAERVPAKVSVAVAHRDIDLRTEAGARTLDRRIWRAVVEVCGDAPGYDIEGKNNVRQCRRDTRAMASAQAQVAIAGAMRDQAIQVSSIGN